MQNFNLQEVDVSRVKNIDELFDTYLIISWESGHAFHDEAVAGQRPGLVEAANLDWKITIGKTVVKMLPVVETDKNLTYTR